MAAKLKITHIGNSSGIILPKEIFEKLRVGKGAPLSLTETPEGFAVSAFDDEFSPKMKLAEDIMREARDVLHQLAR